MAMPAQPAKPEPSSEDNRTRVSGKSAAWTGAPTPAPTGRPPRKATEGPGPAQGYDAGLRAAGLGPVLTLRDLRGQWRGDGDEVALPAAVVHGHLAPLARVAHVAVALGHEQLQGVVPVHEHTWGGGRPREPAGGLGADRPFLPGSGSL